MVSFISPSANPVVFKYSDVVLHHQLDVSLGWDTGAATINAKVFRSLSGGPETVLPGPAAKSGTTVVKIALDEILTFVLRRALNGQELARTTVTTAKDAFATHMTDPDRDFIFGVKIDVGADSVSVGFSTKRPATASVEVRDHASGQLLDSWMGTGFRQQHQRVFDGFGGGLAQDTVFDIRIAALKDIGGGRVRLGAGANNPEIRGTVKTGSRSVSFYFDSVYVRRDGDPGGAGEMTFLFGVGDVATRKQLGPVEQWGEGDISDGGERQLDRTITIDKASRRLWAQANGWDSDTSFGDFLGNPFQGFDGVGLRPAFDWPGTDGHEYNSGAFATVTRHFDTTQLALGRQAPFKLSTGDFAIAFDVFGSVTVTERPGVNQFPGLKLGRVKSVPAANKMMSRTTVLPGGKTGTVMGENGFTHFSLGPDGNVVLHVTEPRSNAASVVDLGGRFESSVTLVAPTDNTIHILGLTPEGEPVATTLSPKNPGGEGWVALGGHFTGALTAATRGESVDVLAVDADGGVFHRHLPSRGRHGEWTPLGGRVVCPVAATATPEGGLAIFGLGPDRSVVHKRLDAKGRMVPDGKEWEVLCTVGGGEPASVGAQWLSDEDLVISVSNADDVLLGALLWRSYPQSDPESQWTAVEEPLRA